MLAATPEAVLGAVSTGALEVCAAWPDDDPAAPVFAPAEPLTLLHAGRDAVATAAVSASEENVLAMRELSDRICAHTVRGDESVSRETGEVGGGGDASSEGGGSAFEYTVRPATQVC